MCAFAASARVSSGIAFGSSLYCFSWSRVRCLFCLSLISDQQHGFTHTSCLTYVESSFSSPNELEAAKAVLASLQSDIPAQRRGSIKRQYKREKKKKKGKKNKKKTDGTLPRIHGNALDYLTSWLFLVGSTHLGNPFRLFGD